MTRWLSDDQQLTWRTFLESSTRLLDEFDELLQQRSGLALTDYEILVWLSEAPDDRLRMNELAQKVLISRSRLTYRVDLLVSRGFVEREECEDDRRGLFAILTATGRGALLNAAPDHVDDVQRLLFDQIEADEFDAFSRVLTRVKRELDNNNHR